MPLDNQTLPEAPQPAERPTLSGHSARLAKLTVQLKDLIARETELLKERKPQEAKRLHGEKSRLMAEYKDTIGKLKVNEYQLGDKASPDRKYLRQLTDALRETIRDHARVVLRLKSVTEGLIRSVGEEVSKKNSPVVGYGRNASMRATGPVKPTSLSLNQVI
ncbi:hypothetical protein ACFO5Q_17640 [Kordiimonas lipolytica]|uniref:FlgN protein n=1 Tax=Kordiimonas lipolytica TaxID=1662421 RepID=A0ABV8UGU6_9PROT|nr:hypothetical protein [Kordiimonas lipolytica]